MKIKFLKKILAAIVAASTVAITPGFASALLPESKAYLQSIEKKKLSLNELQEVINKLGKISQEDDEAKKEVVGAINKMAYLGLLKGYTHKEYLSITDLLKSCADSEKARENVAYAISKMAERDFLIGSSHEELLNITDVLKSCADSIWARGGVASAIEWMSFRDLLNGYTHEELLNITDLLKFCADSTEARQEVASAIRTIAKKDLLKGYTHEEILSITDALKSCVNCANDENDKYFRKCARKYVAWAISEMAEKNLLSEYTHEELLNITNVLKSCSNCEWVCSYVANIILDLVEKGLLNGISIDKILDIKETLLKCGKSKADVEKITLDLAKKSSKT